MGSDTEYHGNLRRAMRYRYLVCGTILLSYILVYFHRLCPAVIAIKMQQAFSATPTLLGVLGSVYFYSYAVMQLPTGLLADSWGPRKTVAYFLIVSGSGSILMGTAPSLSLAVLGRVLVGLGVATVFVCNFKLLSEWFKPSEFVIMGGVFMAIGGIGVLISTAPLAWVSNWIGWRLTMVAVGLATLATAALVFLFVRNRPQDMGWPAVHSSPETRAEATIGLMEGLKMVLCAWRFSLVSFWAFLATGIYFALAGGCGPDPI